MSSSRTAHEELPRTADLRPLPFRLGESMRWAVRLYMERQFDVHLHDTEWLPATGPVILAPNHLSVLDGPLLGAMTPRMVHAVGKVEAFGGIQGFLLRRFGQISIDRSFVDIRALRMSVRALRDGRVISVYPEGSRGPGDFARIRPGVAYLAMVTGAPVLPVALLGTRAAGGSIDVHPPRGTRVDVVFGEPFVVDPVSFPRRRTDVRAVATEIGEVLRAHVRKAVVATGNPLPGGAPEEEGIS
ncbi:MAG: 1-acyl-sn-glycerol-3-phosphate acyltransferase [Kribbellaceae bacterium]|jgi:1-acyl-sn-glycerol-3-phosphate acyltransferase|nr:1-acyl-sn-glycerol-3-phosphate acyltransferase [Kribbellaceae bacterium]